MIEPASSDSGETRFLVYATVREFARDELERRDELAWARDLHAGWIESLIAGFERATYGADEGRMHARLRVELDNIRAALAWSLESGNLARAARIAGNLWSLWSFGGQSDEGRRWMDRILPLLPGSALAPEDERPLQFGAAMVAWAQNDAERAAAHCDRLLALARQLDNPVWQADALMWGAQAAWYANDYERVVELATSALALQEVAPVQAACAQTLLGIVAMRTGRLDDAGIAFERARERLVAQRNTRALIWTLQLIADLRLLQGDDAAFARAHRESLQLALAAADHWGMFENFAGLLTVALRLGWTNEALELLASAELLRTGYSVLPRAGSWLSTDDRVQLRNGLGEDDLLRLSENAASRPLPELVERASEIAREIEQGAKQPAAVQRAVNPHGTSAFALSAREQEVLELLVQGLTDRQIGAELSISQKTARTHVAHVLHKLDARNRAAAVRLALELQMV